MDNFMSEHMENPLPTNHQFFQLMIATAIGFLAKAMAEKVYVSAFKFLARRKRG